jgi:hypothetical protein
MNNLLLKCLLTLYDDLQYVQVSSVVAVGYIHGVNAVHWDVVREIILAWVITIPATGLVHLYLFLNKIISLYSSTKRRYCRTIKMDYNRD